MSRHWSCLLRKSVDSSCRKGAREPSLHLQKLLPSSYHTYSHFTLASPQVFAFDHDQLNHTEFLFPHIRKTQVVLILSLLMQSFWHTGDQCGVNALIWMHISSRSIMCMSLNIHVVLLLKFFQIYCICHPDW